MNDLIGFTHAATTAAFGSYIQLLYVPLDSVDVPNCRHLIDPFGIWRGDIALLPNKNWFELPVVEGSRDWEITSQETKHGDRYTATANGILKESAADAVAELRRMKKRAFCVLLGRPDLSTILIACPVFPAEFTFSTDGNGQAIDRSRTKIKFTAKNNFGFAQLP